MGESHCFNAKLDWYYIHLTVGLKRQAHGKEEPLTVMSIHAHSTCLQIFLLFLLELCKYGNTAFLQELWNCFKIISIKKRNNAPTLRHQSLKMYQPYVSLRLLLCNWRNMHNQSFTFNKGVKLRILRWADLHFFMWNDYTSEIQSSIIYWNKH